MKSFAPNNLNRSEIEWSPLRTLHEGSGGQYEMAPLMAP